MVGELSETVMVLIRDDMLDYLPTQFSVKSSYEIPFATMFIFQKIHVMHSHLISRLPSAYENTLCHFNTFMLIYSHAYILTYSNHIQHVMQIQCNLHQYINYAYILKFALTPHVIQFWSTITQISLLEPITIPFPMHTHNYVLYNYGFLLTH